MQDPKCYVIDESVDPAALKEVKHIIVVGADGTASSISTAKALQKVTDIQTGKTWYEQAEVFKDTGE